MRTVFNPRAVRRAGAGLLFAGVIGAASVLPAAVAAADPYFGDSDATCAYVGGREKVKVTVTGNPGTYNLVKISPDGARSGAGSVEVDGSGTGTAVVPIAPAGSWGFEAYEWNLGSGGGAEGCIATVQVAPADPFLDMVDGVLSSVGSSALVTDPALR